MNSRIEHEIDCPRHPLGGSPNDCTCGLAALEAKAAQWDALDSARMESLIRDDAADAARYRKIKAAVEAKKDVNFTGIINERCDGIGHDGQIEIGFYGMDEAGDVYASGPTLDEAVDAMAQGETGGDWMCGKCGGPRFFNQMGCPVCHGPSDE